MKESFSIGNIKIGCDEKPLIIPEIGINHNGDLETAKSMVDAAHRAGARIIKHQTHIIEDEMSHHARAIKPGNSIDSIYNIMKKCALSEEDEFELMQYVQSKGMTYLSTPFSKMAVDRLERFGVLAYKIGSGEMNNYPLLKYVASFGKPIILSTGMNDINAVRKAVNILEDSHVPFALLHTTNLYPTQYEYVRLAAMKELMMEFSNVPIGYSDHTVTTDACLASISLGASIVEKHFTDYKGRIGPDICCSMDENELHKLLVSSQNIKKMLNGSKDILKEEDITRRFAFASVVSVKKIKQGQKLTRENIWVKRPGTGEFLADEYEDLLGKIAACDIEEDTQIRKELIM